MIQGWIINFEEYIYYHNPWAENHIFTSFWRNDRGFWMLLTWIFHVFPCFSMVVHPRNMGKFPPIPWIMLYVNPKTDGTDENKTCVFSPLFLLALLSTIVFMFKLLTLNSLVALIHFPILQLARRGDCQYLSILKIFFFWWSENGIKWLDSCDALSHLIRNLRFYEILHFDPNHSEGDISPIAAKKVLCFATFCPHIHVR